MKLRPHRQQTVVRRINQKLAPRYFGPYPTLERVGAVSYRIKLPESARIHYVFHVSQLKKAVGSYTVEPELPAELGVEDADVEELEAILATRDIREGDDVTRQFLVKWKG